MINNRNFLQHHGLKGMKWGVRRYQYADGSLTPEGKKRYSRDATSKGYDKYDSESGTYYKNSKKNGKTVLKADPNRYVTDDMLATKKALSTYSNVMKSMGESIGKSSKKKKPMDLSNMTDKELRDKINRRLLERQYTDLYSPQVESKGKKYVSKVLKYAGTALSTAATSVGLAVSVREMLKQ